VFSKQNKRAEEEGEMETEIVYDFQSAFLRTKWPNQGILESEWNNLASVAFGDFEITCLAEHERYLCASYGDWTRPPATVEDHVLYKMVTVRPEKYPRLWECSTRSVEIVKVRFEPESELWAPLEVI